MRKIVLTLLLLLCVSFGFAQDADVWIRNIPEIRMEIGNSPFEVRYRPYDIGKDGLILTHFMAGAKFWKFKLFSFTKYADGNRLWTGLRFETNQDFFDKRFLVNLQARYFIGLNKKSKKHYMLVQFIRWKFSENVRIGAFGMGKWSPERSFNKGEWFVGPSAKFNAPQGFSLHTAIINNLFNSKEYMVFVGLGYNFKVGKKK